MNTTVLLIIKGEPVPNPGDKITNWFENNVDDSSILAFLTKVHGFKSIYDIPFVYCI